LPTDLYPVAPSYAPEHESYQLQLLINIAHQVAAHVETLSIAASPTKPTTSPNPQPILIELRVDDASATLYKVIVTTTLWSTSTPESGQTTRPVCSLNSCPPPAQQPRACGILDTTRQTSFLLTPLEFPHATSINTCYAMMHLRPPLTRHSKLLWKRFAQSLIPPTRKPTPTPSSTQRYVHIKQWPQRGKRDSPTSGASRPRRASPAKNESPSGSCTHVASTPSPPTEDVTSSTDLCQLWKTNDSKSASPQLQKRKHLHSSRLTSLDQTDRTSRQAKRQAGQAGKTQGQV
jgi:hypothetical protein